MTTKRLLLTCMAWLLLGQVAWAQSIDALPLDNRQSLLKDLAFLSFPAAARNEPRAGDLMGPRPNEVKESRIMFDLDEMRLVFSVQNLFSLGGDNLLASIQASDAKIAVQTRTLIDRDGLYAILSTPTTFDSTKQAIFVNSLLVRLPNKTLFRVNCYINPAAYGEKDQFQRLTERIFMTLKPGTRTEDLTARQVELPLINSRKDGFQFDLPANMTVLDERGHDFQVFTYKEYADYDAADWVQIVFYVGDHPSLVADQLDLAPKSGKPVKGTFLDGKVEWLSYDAPDQAVYLMERIIDYSYPGGHRMKFHVAMMSNQKARLPELAQLVAKIRFVEP